MRLPFLLGRIMLGGYFVYNGVNHFRNLQQMSQYAASKRVPMSDLAVAASGSLILAGGASIALGVKPKYGALAIITFLTGVSPVMHDFWRSEDPGQRMNDMINFTKNMALIGASLALTGIDEPWPASLSSHQTGLLGRGRRAARCLA